ncbi:MAG: phosphate signaling complex PhoU family protein, partial [Actinomycetota bacterium]
MVRISFEEELGKAESALLAQGGLVETQLDRVLDGLKLRDMDKADAVIMGDDRVDDLYLATQTRILNLLALQAPVASDLRLVSAILHSNMHVERMGDLCVNIAKFVKNELPYPSDSPMMQRLLDMGARASDMLRFAMDAFARRDVDLAETLPEKDDALDKLNRGMLGDLKEYAGDEQSFEWAI